MGTQRGLPEIQRKGPLPKETGFRSLEELENRKTGKRNHQPDSLFLEAIMQEPALRTACPNAAAPNQPPVDALPSAFL